MIDSVELETVMKVDTYIENFHKGKDFYRKNNIKFRKKLSSGFKIYKFGR